MTDLNMNEKSVEKYLRDNLEGKEFNSYNCTNKVGSLVVDLFPSDLRREIKYSQGLSYQEVYITHEGYVICGIKISKKVSNKERVYGQTTYSYVYKDLEVSIFSEKENPTLQDAFNKTVNLYNKAKSLQDEKDKQYLEIYKFLKERNYINDLSTYTIRSYLEEASKAVYRLDNDGKLKNI